MKKHIQKMMNRLGYKINPVDKIMENDTDFNEIFQLCKPLTMTSMERMYALYKAVKYIIEADIPGDFVECGVWQGGSSMNICSTLLKMGITNRKVYLYDTFTGMSEPTEIDTNIIKSKKSTFSQWRKSQKGDHNEWCYADLDSVKQNMRITGYPEENIVFVQGKVEDTIPQTLPDQISLLRLDTDWYESSIHELNHLYPILALDGVLIIDDYGTWEGAKRAVDEYFVNKPILLSAVDNSGRVGIKRVG